MGANRKGLLLTMTRSESRVAHLMLMRQGWRSRIIRWAGDLTKEVSIEISVGKTRINLETFADVRKFLSNNPTDRDTK